MVSIPRIVSNVFYEPMTAGSSSVEAEGEGSNNLITIAVQSGLLGVRKVYLSLPGLTG